MGRRNSSVQNLLITVSCGDESGWRVIEENWAGAMPVFVGHAVWLIWSIVMLEKVPWEFGASAGVVCAQFVYNRTSLHRILPWRNAIIFCPADSGSSRSARLALMQWPQVVITQLCILSLFFLLLFEMFAYFSWVFFCHKGERGVFSKHFSS